VTGSGSLLERPRISRRAAERAELHHGGALDALPDPRNLPTGQAAGNIPIKDFICGQGGYSEDPADIPTVAASQSITFDNQDAPVDSGIWHTITAREAPCNSSTGIAYPLAKGSIQSGSGELGAAGPPSSGYTTWRTPATLPPGTYSCHPPVHARRVPGGAAAVGTGGLRP
jgi:hypothetical protein